MAVVANLDVILGAKLDQYVRDMRGGISTNEDFQKQLKSAGVTTREWNGAIKKAGSVIESVRTPLERYNRKIEELNSLKKLGLIDTEAYARAEQQAAGVYNKAAGITGRRVELESRAAKVIEDAKTAQQRFDQQMASHLQLKQRGLIDERQYQDAIARTVNQLDRATGAEKRHSEELAKAKNLIRGLETPLDRYNRELREAIDLRRKNRISIEQLNGRRRQLIASYNKEIGHTDRINKKMQEGRKIIESMMSPLERYQRELRDLDGLLRIGAIDQVTFNRAVQKAGFDLNRTSLAARKSALSMTNLTTSMRGFVGVASVGFAAIHAIQNVAGRAIEIDRQLTQSTAIVRDATREQQRLLLNNALEVSRVTRFTAAEASEAYFFLFSAGLDVQQSLAALPEVARFAQAGMFDLATATDLATDAQSALGLTVKDAQKNLSNLKRVTDTLVGANTLANASVQQFSESLTNRAGASMKQLNIDLNEGVATLAAFADQGRKGQRAGEQFAIVMRDLTTKAIKNKAAFKDLGINVFKDGDFQRIPDILREMEDAFGDLSDEAQKTALLDLGFTDKSIAGLTALLGTSSQIEEYFQQLQKTKGVTKEVSDSIRTDLDLALDELGGNLDNLATTVVPLFVDSISQAVKDVNFLAESIRDLSDIAGIFGDNFSIGESLLGDDFDETFDRGEKRLRELIQLATGVELSDDTDIFRNPGSGLLSQLPLIKDVLGSTLFKPVKVFIEDVDELNAKADAIKAAQEAANAVKDEQKAFDLKNFLQGQEELKKLAISLKASLVDPLEKFKSKVNDLKLLLDGGLIKQDEFDKLFDRFTDERDKALRRDDPDIARAEQLAKSIQAPSAKFNEQVRDLNRLLDKNQLTVVQFEDLFEKFEKERDRAIANLNKPDPRVTALERSLETPFDKVIDRINELKQLSGEGLISKDLIERAIDKELGLLDRLDEKQKSIANAINIQDSAARGSAEAFRVIFGRAQNDPTERKLDLANKLSDDQKALLSKILKKLEEQNDGGGNIDPDPIVVEEINW